MTFLAENISNGENCRNYLKFRKQKDSQNNNAILQANNAQVCDIIYIILKIYTHYQNNYFIFNLCIL